MALTKCIECGNSISSLAEICPHCGCPAEFQKRNNNLATEANEQISSKDQIDMSIWIEIRELVRKGLALRAIQAIKKITNNNSLELAKEIVDHIKSTDKIPVDLIIKNYPELSNNPGLHNTSSKPGTMNEWKSVCNLIESGNNYRALKAIQSLTGAPINVAGEIAKKIQDTGEIPVAYITMLYPEEGARIKPEPTTKSCSACGKTISVKAETCPHCGEPTGVHVCPRCGSTDVVYIDAISKAASMAFFGAFSVNTVRNKYECWQCHFKF